MGSLTDSTAPEMRLNQVRALLDPVSRLCPSPKLNKIFILFNYVYPRFSLLSQGLSGQQAAGKTARCWINAVSLLR